MKPIKLTLRAEFGSVMGPQVREFVIIEVNGDVEIHPIGDSWAQRKSVTHTELGESEKRIDVSVEVERFVEPEPEIPRSKCGDPWCRVAGCHHRD